MRHRSHHTTPPCVLGVHDVRKVFETIRWSGLDRVTSWNNYTERVHGTDASQFTYALHGHSACVVCAAPGEVHENK